MKLKARLLTTLVILLSFAVNTNAEYIIKHTPLDGLIGEYTLTDFENIPFPFGGNFHTYAGDVDFDPALTLTDTDHVTIHISGFVSQLTVRGDGVIRPAEDYTVNCIVEPGLTKQNPLNLARPIGGGAFPTAPDFLDDDPAFTFHHILKNEFDYRPPDVIPLPCYGGPDFCGPRYDGGSYLNGINMIVFPAKSMLMQIPTLGELNICPGDICFPGDTGFDGFYPDGNTIYAWDGLEIVGSVTLTITDAYITREWNIPEPASFAMVMAGTVAAIRRKK